jgi:D-alanyl-D-alanine dipeptidase
MLSDKITEEQKANRKILRDAMEKEDFVWYPGEWWHYCFGDRMWAVYSNQKECFYGPIELPF